jgi:signal transduction histidine kinase
MGRTAALFLTDTAAQRRRVLAASAAAILLVTAIDWALEPNLSLGFLYVLPMLLLGLVSGRTPILITAALCAVLREWLGPDPWEPEALSRVVMGLTAFAGAGLFVSELARNRQRAMADAALLADQVRRREEAEEELRILVESSPAAILTAAEDGRVALANEAALRLLSRDGQSLGGVPIGGLLPALGSVFEHTDAPYRTTMECVGHRGDGEAFLAHIWFSTYRTLSGTRLAAIVVDASDELRDRETAGLGSIVNTSRILFAAVSHEVRNLCAAASATHASLARTSELAHTADFHALGELIEGLQRIAASELRLSAEVPAESIDLYTVFDELRIVLEPSYRDAGMRIEWNVAEGLSPVLGDHHSLLQIFLNLAQNSLREMMGSDRRLLTVSALPEGEAVIVRFRDTGPGISDPDQLFRPFRRGGERSGLGLFVSRTIARHFAGDLRYEPCAAGSCFAVSLVHAT